MKQSQELPHVRHSSLLEAKEDKKPKATATLFDGRRHVSCLKKKTQQQTTNPNKPMITEILDVTAVINSEYLVLVLFLKQ